MANGSECFRPNRTQEVAGSSPASSITKTPANKEGAASFCRAAERLVLPPIYQFWGSWM